MRIELKLGSSKTMVEMHFDHRISSQSYRYFCSPTEEGTAESDGEDDMSEWTKDISGAPSWIHKLFAIPGVTGVAIYQYEIDLNKARLFSWEAIMAAVLGILPYELNPEAVVSLSLAEGSEQDLRKVLRDFQKSRGIKTRERRIVLRRARKVVAKKPARKKVTKSSKKQSRSKRV